MTKTYYRPIRIAFVNQVNTASLDVPITLPDKTVFTNDFTGYVYTFRNDAEQPDCAISILAPFVTSATAEVWQGPYATTYSTKITSTSDARGNEYGTFLLDFSLIILCYSSNTLDLPGSKSPKNLTEIIIICGIIIYY
ncbi:uncharacterized protein ZBAI_03574 [Zygosaccharomyces bailii ISA1307]|nr:uncharacterized protein ZBAI_03574 [Zygosaccharomyces bailii ISA1307]